MHVDHVIYGTTDLAGAARRFQERYGLASVEGGAHPEYGTANRIVPLGVSYIELMTVADPVVARGNPVGRWLADALERGDGFLTWVVAAHNIDPIAARVGMPATPGSRVRPDGTTVSWRTVGIDHALATPPLPFFIQWDLDSPHPGGDVEDPRAFPTHIEWIEMGGDEEALTAWLDDAALPYVISGATPRIIGVGVRALDGKVVEIRP